MAICFENTGLIEVLIDKLKFIETFDNQLTSFDCTMLPDLEFLHIDYNKLTTLDMSQNPKDPSLQTTNWTS